MQFFWSHEGRSSLEGYVIQIWQKTFTKAFNPLKRGIKNRKDDFVKAILGFKKSLRILMARQCGAYIMSQYFTFVFIKYTVRFKITAMLK